MERDVRVVVISDDFERVPRVRALFSPDLPTFRDEFSADRLESKRVQNTF